MASPEPTTSSRRLVGFLVGLATSLIVLELGVRMGGDTLFLVAQRALFKLAVLERQAHADTLFFGTSRAAEGLVPALFDRALPGRHAFNLAVANSSLDVMAYEVDRIADRLAARGDLALIELSETALVRKSPPWLEEAPPPRSFDAQVWRTLEAHSQLVALRKSLILDNLARLFGVVLFASRLDGSEWRGGDYVRAVLGTREAFSAEFRPDEWRHRLWRPAGAGSDGGGESDPSLDGVSLDPSLEAAVTTYQRIAQRLLRAHTTVVFVVMPVTRGREAFERTPAFRRFLAEAAKRTGAPIWDFSDSDTPDAMFRDSHHLAGAGAWQFSACVAELARNELLRLQPEEGRRAVQ